MTVSCLPALGLALGRGQAPDRAQARQVRGVLPIGALDRAGDEGLEPGVDVWLVHRAARVITFSVKRPCPPPG